MKAILLSGSKRKFVYSSVMLPFNPLSTYGEPVAQLGEGTYGKVFKYQTKDGRSYAVKTMGPFVADSSDTFIPRSAYREIIPLVYMHHPNIISLIDICIVRKDGGVEVNMVMELASGDLSNLYRAEAVENLRSFSFQLSRAVAYCTASDTLNRDIKPQNILIFDCPVLPKKRTRDQSFSKRAVLADFGLSKSLLCHLDQHDLTNLVYTLWYRPPEILLGGKYGDKADVWALGCVIAQIALQKPLFPGDSEIDMLFRIFRTLGTPTFDANESTYWPNVKNLPDWKPQFPQWKPSLNKVLSSLSPLLADLITKMLILDPDRRISIFAALRHPYFTGMEAELNEIPCLKGPAILHEPSCEDRLLSRVAKVNIEWDDGKVKNTSISLADIQVCMDEAANYMFSTGTSLRAICLSSFILYSLLEERSKHSTRTKLDDVDDAVQVTSTAVYMAQKYISTINLEVILFSNPQVVAETEISILQDLSFNLNVATASDFLTLYTETYSGKVQKMADAFTVFSLRKCISLRHLPQQVALASLFLSTTLNDERFLHTSKLTPQVLACVKDVTEELEKSSKEDFDMPDLKLEDLVQKLKTSASKVL